MGKRNYCSILIVWAIVSSIEGTSLDVVILLDSSDAFRSQYFQQEKAFAVALIDTIYHENTRIAAYTFGSNTFCQFPFDMYTDKALMKQAVQFMWYSTGNGNLEAALRQTLNDAFQVIRGDRECVANTIFVLTHTSISPVAASQVNQIASVKRVRLIIVNLGGPADFNLNVLTNGTDRVFSVGNMALLQSAVAEIASKIKSDIPNTGCGVLTQWSDWSVCSMTCGQGFRSRTRRCVTADPTDKPCYAALGDSIECFPGDCTDPIDGDWAYWGSWSECTKSCEKGSQTRMRTCTQPEPVNGGKPCIGNNTQTRVCAEWTCPDCTQTCPGGGVISEDCSFCLCNSVSLFGQLIDEMNYTVENAEVFLESRRHSPIAITDAFGFFRIEGVCLMNEKIHITSRTHVDVATAPVFFNTTHASLPVFRMEKYVPPVITLSPEDKVRLSGQSVSLCCNGTGRPQPSTYKWYKNGKELEHRGADGKLVIQSATLSDSAQYICYTETEAGVSRSEPVQLTVTDQSVTLPCVIATCTKTVKVKYNALNPLPEFDTDSCGSPVQLLQELPAGCHVANDATRNSTIDVGSCGKRLCTTSSLHDNGSCSDYWPFHCCESDAVETVNIACDGFTYKTSRILSCACMPCSFKTVVTGLAFGRRDGQDVPLQLGEVNIDGETVAMTSMSGFFTFEVPRGLKRLVVTFYDSIFKIFAEVLKIIHINEGTETFVTIVVPFKPEPIAFQAANGTEIDLGMTDKLSPSAKLSIPSDAMVTADGKPYYGKAKASITYTDPRNRDDMDAVNGVFEYETPDGNRAPMITYGMFDLKLTDESGNPLSINKDISISMNNDTLHIPNDIEGKPDASLWYFDQNKGIWVEIMQMMSAESMQSGKRKLLQSQSQNIFGIIRPSDGTIPKVNQFDTKTVRTIWNVDKGVTRYTYTTVKEPKAGACFLSVAVFKDMRLSEVYDANDIEIKTYVFKPDSGTYIGAESTLRLLKGHACIPIMCKHLIEVSVIKNGKERLMPGNSYLPHPGYILSNIKDELSFFSEYIPEQQVDKTQPHLLPDTRFHGPVYQYTNSNNCTRKNGLEKSFMLKFAPKFSKEPSINYVVGSGVHNHRLSWYPVSPTSFTFRTCFMKVKILVDQTYDFRIVATSHIGTVRGDEFGSYEVSPTPDPTETNEGVRAACLEFRCPGLVYENGIPVTHLDTVVAARFTYSGSLTKCRLSETKSGLNVASVPDPNKGELGFDFTADPGNNFGPKFGVFIADRPAADTLRYCLSGIDSGGGVFSTMRPNVNPAVTFNCTGK